MNIFKKFESLENITHNEQILIEYIIENPDEFISLKPKDISAKTFVSVPTIYRLITKLGLNGVNELKVEIRSALKDDREFKVENIDFPILSTDTNYEIMLRLNEVYGKTIKDTLDLADPEILVKAAQLMNDSKSIDVYASAANIFFAKNFQFQMQEINSLVNVPEADYMQRLTAANSDPNHLAIIISFGGRGTAFEAICKCLRANRTPILLITSTQYNPISQYANHEIFMSSYENHYNKISSFSTRMSLLYILDTLYSIYFSHNYDNNLNFKVGTYERMRSLMK